MNKIKERLKNVGFWISLASSVMLIISAFGVEIGDETVTSVINGVASFLVVCGIVSDPTSGMGYLDGLTTVLDAAEKADIPVAAAIRSVISDMQSGVDASVDKTADAEIDDEKTANDTSGKISA